MFTYELTKCVPLEKLSLKVSKRLLFRCLDDLLSGTLDFTLPILATKPN